MIDLHTMRAIQAYCRNHQHAHARATDYTHAGDIGADCLYQVFLARKQGYLNVDHDEWTLDTFAQGVMLEPIHEMLLLKANPDWKLARVPKKGRPYARDNGQERLSPTFKYDENYQLGGSIDRAFIAPEIPFLPVELKTSSWQTKSGNPVGKVLWELAEALERGENKPDLFDYILEPDTPRLRYLKKWGIQTLANIYLWNAPVGYLSIYIKEVGRVLPMWVHRDSYLDVIYNKILKPAELVAKALEGKAVIYRTQNWDTCSWCPNQLVCAPEIAKRDTQGTITDPYIIDLVEKVNDPSLPAREMKEVEDELKKEWRSRLEDDSPLQQTGFVVGRYMVKIRKVFVKGKTIKDYLDEGKTEESYVINPYFKRLPNYLPLEPVAEEAIKDE